MDREAVLISMTTAVIIMFLADLFALSVYWSGDKVDTKVARINETERRLTKSYGSGSNIGGDEDADYNENELEKVAVGNYYTKDLFTRPAYTKVEPAKNYGFQNDISPPGALQFIYYHYPSGHLTLLAPEQDDQDTVSLKDQTKKHIMETIMNKLKSDNRQIYSPPRLTKTGSVWFARYYLETIK